MLGEVKSILVIWFDGYYWEVDECDNLKDAVKKRSNRLAPTFVEGRGDIKQPSDATRAYVVRRVFGEESEL